VDSVNNNNDLVSSGASADFVDISLSSSASTSQDSRVASVSSQISDSSSSYSSSSEYPWDGGAVSLEGDDNAVSSGGEWLEETIDLLLSSGERKVRRDKREAIKGELTEKYEKYANKENRKANESTPSPSAQDGPKERQS